MPKDKDFLGLVILLPVIAVSTVVLVAVTMFGKTLLPYKLETQ